MKHFRRVSPRLEALGDRLNPVVVNGTTGDDLFTTQLLYHEGESSPYAADVLLNGTVAATLNVVGFWPHPTVTWYVDQNLELNGLGGNDRIEVGLIRPQDFGATPPGDTEIVLNGGAGNDTLVGGNGSETVIGGPGADDLFAGIDEDRVYGDSADTRLVGGGGQDRLEMDVAGYVQITDTTLTLGTRTLTTDDGTYGGFVTIVLNGSAGPDVIDASGYGNVVAELYGNGGNDRLSSGASSRTFLDGGDGHDTLMGSPADDTLSGGSGNDLLFGGDDWYPTFTVNQLYGGLGNDTIVGGLGYNTLGGGPGNDNLWAGPIDSTLYGEQGRDTLTGGAGNDYLFGDALGQIMTRAADVLDGGGGDDALFADAADTRLLGGRGFDGVTITRVPGTAVLTDSTWTVNGRATPARGLEYATISGSPRGNTIDVTAFSGRTNLSGMGGNDTLRAGPGGSTLDGGPGVDALVGGAGDDELYGDALDNRFEGAGGNNVLIVNDVPGTAVLTNTTLTFNGRSVPATGLVVVVLSGDDGANELDASSFTGSVSLFGNGGADELIGSNSGSYLSGGAGDDSVTGGSAADTLYGDDGTDTLKAGGGDDYLDGGAGTDALTGGAGADQFVKDAEAAVWTTEKAASDFDASEGDTEL